MNSAYSLLLEKFEASEIEPDTFHHSEHVEAAYEMLRRYPFLEATWRYAETIRALAETAGAPDKFNVTITVAFLSVIAERMKQVEYADYQHFIEENADLGSAEMLNQRYSAERLGSRMARQVFLLPDKQEVE